MDSIALDEQQQRLVDLVYDLFRERGAWPTFAVIDRKMDQLGLDAEAILRELPREILRGGSSAQQWFAPGQEVSLTLRGVAASDGAGPDLDILVTMVRWLGQRERDHDPAGSGTELTVDHREAVAAIGMSPDDPTATAVSARLVGLIDLIPGVWAAKTVAGDLSSWSLTVARGIRRYRGVGSPEELVDLVVGRQPEGEVVAQVASESGPSTEALEEEPYDVALSFAGEERAYVDRVAARLTELGVAVFYDQFEVLSLWGTNLIDRFADVYGRRARFVVMFASAAYAEKAWTNEERRQAQAHALEARRDLVLPVRFDDTDVPGLPRTVHYLDAKDYEPERLAELIARKIQTGKLGGGTGRDLARRPSPARSGGIVPPAADAEATPAGSADHADVEMWRAPHRTTALAGLAEMGKADFYEVTSSVSPQLPMPSQRALADAVAKENIDTFGWPIGVFLPSQPPRPVVDGIVMELRWDERNTYDYWAFSRTGKFYLLKTPSEDALGAPEMLYFNTRIIRIAETVMFLAGAYAALGAGPQSLVTLEIVHSGIRHRTLSAVGRRRGTFIERHTIEDLVSTHTTFSVGDVDARLVDIVKELVGPLFMVYEYFEVADSVLTDLVTRYREGEVT